MRIALDARTIYAPQRRGTGKNLIDLYREVLHLRPHWQVEAFHRAEPDDVDRGLMPLQCHPQHLEMPGDRLDAWQRLRLPMAAWRSGADVLHCPANHCPSWMPIPTVVTIHDLIPLDDPDRRHTDEGRRFERSIRQACRRATHLVSPSKYTRDRLVAEFNADPGRATVNHWAADKGCERITGRALDAVLDRWDLRCPYVLHLGAADPRKNTRGLLDAWAAIDDAARRDWTLLIVGLDETTRADLERHLVGLPEASGVRLEPFAPEEDLAALISGAEVLAYPSLSEGFGLPVLDAWTCETAVMIAGETCLPEIAGGAALPVDPRRTEGMATGLQMLLEDEPLRRALVDKGLHRLRSFTWRQTANRFIEVMESINAVPLRKAA